MTASLSLCATCLDGQPPGTLAQVRAAVGAAAEVRAVDCLNLCARPLGLAFRAPGKAAYLFAGVDPAAQVTQIAAFAALYAAAPDGTITDSRPAGALRLCLVGRIPA